MKKKMTSNNATESEYLKYRQRSGSVSGTNNGDQSAIPSSTAEPPASAPASGGSTSTSLFSRASSILMGPHTFDSRPILSNSVTDSGLSVRKSSDFDKSMVENMENFMTPFEMDDSSHYSSSSSSTEPQDSSGQKIRRSSSNSSKRRIRKSKCKSVAVLRSRENLIIHFLMELSMFRHDFVFIVAGLFFQLVHSASTNLAYYYHTKLTAAQRIPLQDMAFQVLPTLTGHWWMVSEYICYTMIAIAVFFIVSVLVVRWTGVPHGRPMYVAIIVRRMLMNLCACQALRCISFLVTTLPGASRQCLYTVPDYLTKDEMMNGPADESGNPVGYAPPETLSDILFRVDATNGCGDLMFSSHTIFTMTFVCVVFKYFNWRSLKITMLLSQFFMIPFILAAHKHYTVDVFTALYVTPLVFEMLWIRFPDWNSSADMAKHYGIRFYRQPVNPAEDPTSIREMYMVGMWGREYYIDPEDVPLDLLEALTPIDVSSDIERGLDKGSAKNNSIGVMVGDLKPTGLMKRSVSSTISSAPQSGNSTFGKMSGVPITV